MVQANLAKSCEVLSNHVFPDLVPILRDALANRGTARVTFWGAFALAMTAGIGALIGKEV